MNELYLIDEVIYNFIRIMISKMKFTSRSVVVDSMFRQSLDA